MDINDFDAAILSIVNGITRSWWLLDSLIVRMKGNLLVKGGVMVGVMWWLWFAVAKYGKATRQNILATLLGAFGAVFMARVLALVLPFRPRPLHDSHLDFRPPLGMNEESLDGWSSFPSDHAALFCGLALGLFFISRRLGWIMFCYFAIIICIPRVYCGLHYATDILAGAVLGMACIALSRVPILKDRVTKPALLWSRRHPPSFYACFFLLTFQVATLFRGVRGMAGFAWDVVKAML